MKILLIDLVLGAGGGQRSFVQLFYALQRLGNEVSALVATGSWLDLHSGIDKKYLSAHLTRKSSRFIARSRRMLIYIFCVMKNVRQLTRSDLVVINDPELLLPFLISNILLRKKSIFYAHLIYTHSQIRFLRLIFTFFSVEYVICCSEFLKQHLLSSLNGVLFDCKLIVINPQIDPRINFLEHSKFPIAGVATFGRLVPSKGHDVLKRLAKKNPMIQFYIAGEYDPSADQFIKELQRDCPDNLTLIGYQSDISSCCKKLQINCILVCSRDNKEAFGLVALEAVKMGLSLIVRSTGGLVEVADILSIPIAVSDEDFEDKFQELLAMSESTVADLIKIRLDLYEKNFDQKAVEQKLRAVFSVI